MLDVNDYTEQGHKRSFEKLPIIQKSSIIQPVSLLLVLIVVLNTFFSRGDRGRPLKVRFSSLQSPSSNPSSLWPLHRSSHRNLHAKKVQFQFASWLIFVTDSIKTCHAKAPFGNQTNLDGAFFGAVASYFLIGRKPEVSIYNAVMIFLYVGGFISLKLIFLLNSNSSLP